MANYKSRLEMLNAMAPEDRSHYFQVEKLMSEESWLKFMVDSMRETDSQVELFTRKAKEEYWNYENLGEEGALDRAEQYIALAKEARDDRYTLSDIRKQRERVQWQRKVVSQMTTKLLDGNSIGSFNSSSHSKS